ncbi:MAG TPA: CU044_5270 family protein [Trebonia sp.]|nr:CU044_5270 family protein [Trebonia sp.]
MNDLKLLADLRSEVPLEDGTRLGDAVIASIPFSERDHRRMRGGAPRRRVRRRALRPLLAGTLAAAVGAGAFAAVELSGAPASRPRAEEGTVAWSGHPTAAWPAAGHPSYGRASSAAQLVDYMTRAAASAPGRAPKPDEWVVVKSESADSSGGSGGYLFGPPDKREISLQWFSGETCGPVASVPPVPATTAPDKTVTGTLSIGGGGQSRIGCSGTTLGGWQSVSYDYLNSLPADPAALEEILASSAGPVTANTREQAIFQAIATLLDAGEVQGVVVPPKLSATLYRVLQQLPGVTFESATDLAGRRGIGFSMVLEGYLKLEIVIDPDTYTYMGYEYVAIKDHAMTGTDGTQYVKAGHVMGWGALLGSAIVDKPGQLP